MRFVDLFAGLGGFHRALTNLGHTFVFASEIDDELRSLYIENFPIARNRIGGDLRRCKAEIPSHDILCAGFPCQPFSKSGFQRGMKDQTQGTLFHEILDVLKRCRPEYVILENVGNFERHDGGRTWQIVRANLQSLGYEVRGTEHVASGGNGLLSPHHLGYPHSRERFYVVARRGPLENNPFPASDRARSTTLSEITQPNRELTACDRIETRINIAHRECIEHWNLLLSLLPSGVRLPSFPIWSDELDATYPYDRYTPFAAPLGELRRTLNGHGSRSVNRQYLLAALPSYARVEAPRFPAWKIAFIRQNRSWFEENRKYFAKSWISKLRSFPSSLRKLEWNCQGEERNLWKHVLQFRPSGLRVKRYTTSPSLVAMTSTQIPILGPKRRHLTRTEALRLQGFPDDHRLPKSRAKSFKALGNAVHVGVVEALIKRLLG